MENIENQPITIGEYKKKLNKLTCNVSELAEILGVSVAKARNLVRIEGFPVLRIGRDYRIILSQLDLWLSNNIGSVL